MRPYCPINWKRVVLSGIASLKKGNKGPNSTPHGLLSRPREEYQNYHWAFKRLWSKWAIMSARNCRTCVVKGLARLHMYWKSSWRQICQNISCWVDSPLWSKSLHGSSRWDKNFHFWMKITHSNNKQCSRGVFIRISQNGKSADLGPILIIEIGLSSADPDRLILTNTPLTNGW